MLFPVLAGLTFLAHPGPVIPAPAPQGLDDATIVAIFESANTYDIETGTLGQQKAASSGVRAVATSLIRYHKAVRPQGRDLARKLGVTPTAPAVNPLAARHAQALSELKAKTGTEFDKAFLDHEIAYHQAVFDAVTQTLLPAIKNAELRKFVESVAPAFQAHLDMCKAARAQLTK